MSSNQSTKGTAPKLSPEIQAIRADQAKARAMLKEHGHKLDDTITSLLKSNHPDNFREGLKLAEDILGAEAAELARIEKLLEDANKILDGEFGKQVRKQIRRIKNSGWIINIVKQPAKQIRNPGTLKKAVNILRKEEAKARLAAEAAVEIKEEAPVAETLVEAPVEAEQPRVLEPEPSRDSVDIEELMRVELAPSSDKPHKPGYGRSRPDRGRGHSRSTRRH